MPQSAARARDLANINYPLIIKISFRFYKTVFYFLGNNVLVIAIVNICFKKGGTERRDNAQQNSASERNF
ncbi:hypothetical protein DP157_20710 [Klebsiella michiganensis]|nr:hypothetical protein [Klebsiella michiganensis]